MNTLNKHTTLEEIKAMLDESKTQEPTLEALKNHHSIFDDVNGLVELLKKNNWNYQVVKEVQENAESDFIALLNQSNSTSKSNFSWLKIAAVVVPLIGVSVFLFLYFQQPSEADVLYSKYHIEEKGLPTLMSSINSKKFDEAMAAFKDGAYNEAELGFRELYKTNANNDTLIYFIGCTKMEQEDFEIAIEMYKKIHSESIFIQKAQYRLSLCLIKIEDYNAAKSILNEISNVESHIYKEQALKMLEESIFN